MRRAAFALLVSSTAIADPGLPLDRPLPTAWPRALPCDAFRQVDFEVEPRAKAGVAWGAVVFDPGHHPTTIRDLPTAIRLLAPSPIRRATLTLSCDEHQPELDPRDYVAWSCGAVGCEASVAREVHLDRARLRLCARATDGKDHRLAPPCPPGDRDARPAFGDRAAALSLLRALLDETRRSITDGCRAVATCSALPDEVARRIAVALAQPLAITAHAVAPRPKAPADLELAATARGGRFIATLTAAARSDGTLYYAEVRLVEEGRVILPSALFGDDLQSTERFELASGDVALDWNDDEQSASVAVSGAALATAP